MAIITLNRAQFDLASKDALDFYQEALENAELDKKAAIEAYIVRHTEWQAKKWFFKEKPLTYEQADYRLKCVWNDPYDNACCAIRKLKKEIDDLIKLTLVICNTEGYGVDTIQLVTAEVELIFSYKEMV